MSDSTIIVITSVCSMIISIVSVLGIIYKFSDKLIRRMLCKGLDSIKLDDLNPNSDLYKVIVASRKNVQECDSIRKKVDAQNGELSKLLTTLTEVSSDLHEMKRDRFRSDLRSRLEYAITKKGKVDSTYWDHISQDYNYYVDVLHMNSYMGSLYKEAEALYIKYKFKNGSKET